mgnify:CR=1 FL=1
MARIGFVGLGTMGAPMAANLVKAGHAVRGFDKAESARAAAAARGVPVVADLARAIEGAEAVVSMLPDTPDVEAALLGPGGVAERLAPGGIVIDTSSIAPAAAVRLAERLAERGLAFLDAPVTGGPGGAEAGTLGIMVGGEPEAFERAHEDQLRASVMQAMAGIELKQGKFMQAMLTLQLGLAGVKKPTLKQKILLALLRFRA